MAGRTWIVTSHRRVDLRDVEILLGYRGPFPSSDDPEMYRVERDAQGKPTVFVQPVNGARITVTLDQDWRNWPPERAREVRRKLGGPIRHCITLDYKSRAELEGIDREPIMAELLATAERALHFNAVWLRIIGEYWRWPAVLAGYNGEGKFWAFTAEESLSRGKYVATR